MTKMSHFRSALAGRDSHIRSLRVALGVMTAVALSTSYGWYTAGQNFNVHNPPDLSDGSTRPWWEVPKPNVYDFAVNIFGLINYWKTDGAEDYENNLHLYKYYLTEQCRTVLEKDAKLKHDKGELSGRERSLVSIPGYGYDDWRVKVHSKDSWTVMADLELKEHIDGVLVKQNYTRWPLRIVRYDVDLKANPWGLAIDCFDGLPRDIQFTKQESQ